MGFVLIRPLKRGAPAMYHVKRMVNIKVAVETAKVELSWLSATSISQALKNLYILQFPACNLCLCIRPCLHACIFPISSFVWNFLFQDHPEITSLWHSIFLDEQRSNKSHKRHFTIVFTDLVIGYYMWRVIWASCVKSVESPFKLHLSI